MKEREKKLDPKGLLTAIGFSLLAYMTGCSKAEVVNGVAIEPESACKSPPITIEITPKTKKIILFDKEFTVDGGRVDGFSVNTRTGGLVADAGDVNGDGNPDVIEASVAGNKITASLKCGTKQNTGSNK
jgi:hypothetical protein